jgi:hypothetical protein
VKVLAEIPPPSPAGLRTGALRRADLEAFAGLLASLPEARSLLLVGEAPRRRRVSAGLAAAAAAGGARTALLEADLAAPGLAEELGLATAPGLHEYLRGAAASEAILKPVVLAGPASGGAREPLVCVVAGRPASDAPALLGCERFRHMAAGLRDAYELLVVDGPPPGRDDEVLAAMAVADATLVLTDDPAWRPSLPAPPTGLLLYRS